MAMNQADILDKLRILAALKPGDPFPEGWNQNAWGPTMTALLNGAIAEIEYLRNILDTTATAIRARQEAEAEELAATHRRHLARHPSVKDMLAQMQGILDAFGPSKPVLPWEDRVGMYIDELIGKERSAALDAALRTPTAFNPTYSEARDGPWPSKDLVHPIAQEIAAAFRDNTPDKGWFMRVGNHRYAINGTFDFTVPARAVLNMMRKIGETSKTVHNAPPVPASQDESATPDGTHGTDGAGDSPRLGDHIR